MRKHNIALAPSFKAKRERQTKKGAKNSLPSKAYIFFYRQTFAPHGYLFATTVKCLKFAGRERSTRRICIWEKATTKKRITMLMKETKIKTSSLSLTLKPGNKILVRSITFFAPAGISPRRRNPEDALW